MLTAEKPGSPSKQQEQQQQARGADTSSHVQQPPGTSREPPGVSESSDMAEPSAPQLPPPSYDDVLFEQHLAHTDPGHSVETESAPLISTDNNHRQNARDANTLSSQEFFAQLQYKRTAKGYSSSDAWLNTSTEALRRFINECNNDKPRVSIEVIGSHTYQKPVETFRTDENGRQQRYTTTQTEYVTDFKFVLELTPDIYDKGSLYTARANDGQPYDLDKVLEDYVKADNFLKEIQVQKKVIWDYDLVRREITAFIRNTGYPHTVKVSFPMENEKITVRSHNQMAQVWRHPVTSFLCFVTCLCVVGWPVRYLAARRWKNKIMSDFVVLASPKDFVDRNSTFIRNQVSWSYLPQFMPFPTPVHYCGNQTN
ncbi:hypothetical protein H4R99_000457 [Coemansia sp. RSA 1722]|nr:hypothetical protein H4R99_000457 [Coemansia sp. RSA 1722]